MSFTMKKKIILATNNLNKIVEFENLFNKSKFEIISQKDYNVSPIEEVGSTFKENAFLKAMHATKITNLPALSDDSGLTIKVWGNVPGIYSSRYAGKNASDHENIKKLLNNMKNFRKNERKAYFHCTLVYLNSINDKPIVVYKKWKGTIVTSYSYFSKKIFGYDSIFYIPSLKKTVDQLSVEEKSKISHRGRALKSLLSILNKTLF